MIEYISQYLVHKYTYDLICKDQNTGKTTNQDNQQLRCHKNRCHHRDKCHLSIFTPTSSRLLSASASAASSFLILGPKAFSVFLALLSAMAWNSAKKNQTGFVDSTRTWLLIQNAWVFAAWFLKLYFICSLVFIFRSPAHQTTTPAASLLDFILMCCSPLILDKKQA